MRSDDPSSRCGPTSARGFTLLELMMVVTILALAGQLVVINLPALIPASSLDSAARTLANTLEFVRSEAQLHAQTYEVELDLDNHNWRILMPIETKLTSSEVTLDDEGKLDWVSLDKHVQFGGYQLVGEGAQRNGIAKIKFDANGFTADQVIYLRHREEDSQMIWSLQLRGLDRATKIVKNHEGVEVRLEPVLEAHFQ